MGGKDLMSDAFSKPEDRDTWQVAITAGRSMSMALPGLRENIEVTLAEMKKALNDVGDRGSVLVLLGSLNSSFTSELVQDLVGIAVNHRDALRVRQLLGRLPYREAYDLVPKAVWRQLAETNDDDAYRRMAELLRHLGLEEALQDLCRRVEGIEDEAIGEVARDFRQ
jgi:hypothetical protein